MIQGDYNLFLLFNELSEKYFWVDVLAIFFAHYFGYVIVGSSVALLVVNRKKYWPIIWRSLAAAFISRFIFASAIHFLWFRPRPFVHNDIFVLLEHANTASFPSGHATFYFAFAATVFFLNKKLGIVFLGGATAVSLARVFVGIHWPSDIIGGALLGLFSSFLIIRFTKGTENHDARRILRGRHIAEKANGGL